MKELLNIQTNLKAPKGQFNAFGKYKYRSCEDILEAVKPLLTANNCILTIKDDIIEVGGRVYVKATATVTNSEGQVFETSAFARESLEKKGMDDSQITGAASSYARKYALNGLFAIDDAKDADTMDNRMNGATVKTVSFDWSEAVKYLKEGGKIDAITKKYKLTEAQIKDLTTAANGS